MYLTNSFRSPANLGYFRTNQAMNYGRYATRPALSGMGALSVSPTLLALGVGAAVLAGVLFFGGKRKSPEKRRIARLAAQRAIAARELREAGA